MAKQKSPQGSRGNPNSLQRQLDNYRNFLKSPNRKFFQKYPRKDWPTVPAKPGQRGLNGIIS